jgi:hypothetical protein
MTAPVPLVAQRLELEGNLVGDACADRHRRRGAPRASGVQSGWRFGFGRAARAAKPRQQQDVVFALRAAQFLGCRARFQPNVQSSTMTLSRALLRAASS